MGKRSEDEQDRSKKVGPPFHKQIPHTKLMGFISKAHCEHERDTGSKKCTSQKNALFLHDLRPVLEKKSPLKELLRHKPQELEKRTPWK